MLNKKKKILVLCPHLSEKGGVANYYSLVKKHFFSDKVSLNFFFTGVKTHNKKQQNRILRSLLDLFSLITIFPQYDLIVLNPSLDTKAVIRDGVFHLLAKRIFRKKTIVFFRGWLPEFEKIIANYGKRLFKFFFCWDHALVLSDHFKNILIEWGFDPKTISLETTAFEKHEFKVERDPNKIIFLSRLTKGKGCLEAIQTIETLVDEFPSLKLFMVGEGELTQELKNYVFRSNLHKHIEFTGWLDGKKKYNLLNQCGIMLLPSYTEGMPNSILEGMGMGLVIVSRPVGGIPEVIKNGKNGFLVESLDPKYFAKKVKFLLQNNAVCKTISERNSQEAEEKFEIKNVVKRLEKLYFEIA